MTKEEKINKIVEGLEESTDFAIMKEMKEILNKTFGEENNQILKPNYFSVRRIAYEDGNLNGFLATAKEFEVEELTRHIKLHMGHSLYYQILIKFPEIEITNGVHKHTIKDLYVRAFIRPNGTIRTGIDGIRGKLNIEEVRSQYLHSHLPYSNPRDLIFQPFCTGIGPINQVMMILNNKYTTTNFKMFLFHLKVYVAWESLEGRPHMYIENIGKGNSNDVYYLGEGAASDVADRLVRTMKDIPTENLIELLDYDVLPTKITVNINDKFEKWASETIRGWDLERMMPGYSLETNCLLNTKDNSGRYYPIPRSGARTDLYDPEKVILQFKGQDIKLKVEEYQDPNIKTIKDEEKVPHRLITKYLCQKLSSTLSQKAFGNARIRLGRAGSGEPKAAGSNPLYV